MSGGAAGSGTPDGSAAGQRPLVLVAACNRLLGDHPYHVVGRKYVAAVRLAGALPLVVPALRDDEVDAALALADGVLLTGSPSNVHPSHFGQPVHDASLPLDPERDAWTLRLAPRALALGVPLLAICRGAQEVNVALGGTLHQAVHELPGRADHRADDDEPADTQYAPAHGAALAEGGLLRQLLQAERITVNSLHGQAIDRLGQGLQVEALAEDGTVEAFRAPAAPGFNLCLQWHPEWRAEDNPVSRRLFAAFGEALAQRRARRSPAPRPATDASA